MISHKRLYPISHSWLYHITYNNGVFDDGVINF